MTFYKNIVRFTLTYEVREDGILLKDDSNSDNEEPTKFEKRIPDLLEFVLTLEEFINCHFMDKIFLKMEDRDLSYMWMHDVTFSNGSFQLFNCANTNGFQEIARNVITTLNKNKNSFTLFGRTYTVIYKDLFIDDENLEIKNPG